MDVPMAKEVNQFSHPKHFCVASPVLSTAASARGTLALQEYGTKYGEKDSLFRKGANF